ncbi:STAS domain-containing protein [Maridesulfovibrio ferrireducens]|uniref:STAS domain-containing protein n=1 Tax=Maridesulfovibrio ferrireducens TaxID=246191 RepID=UPI001A32835A|nr:STAS domain-containing protein [Maridesulfovibrio ferrireducens]MBI9111906.1 STAS domain-containing protein [Maridesulfovibrio ferrireducens]
MSDQIIDTGHKFDSGEGRTASLPFDLSEEIRGDSTVLSLHGVYNTQTVKHLKPRLYELSEEWDGRTIVDLNKALFIDVSCLAVFFKAHKTARRKRGSVIFVNRNEHIQKVFRAVKMDRILNIVPSLEAADVFLNDKAQAV